jgi:hypothetical protein
VRTPDLLFEYASQAASRGLSVMIAGAGPYDILVLVIIVMPLTVTFLLTLFLDDSVLAHRRRSLTRTNIDR